MNTANELSSISCHLKTFALIKLGQSISENPLEGIKEGDFVKMRVDRIKNKIEWLKRRQGECFEVICECTIPRYMKKKHVLYPIVSLVHSDDKIRIVV
jgi:hypothetical protein